eukprot:gnl/TRDRNA2_/TRDRNA2_195082_c0_seq1.p1 gnl/TRDRNA2_/TRDRNA2_195082_c0~~gnl/TRDRNA2_/TRDRNA2_195082_c0_seq1.p1  ORF type:complete len:290 (-),score=57.78 gnl/TRDRNA2_/TRDRNA2_195082_c0_seq1:38-829(-)
MSPAPQSAVCSVLPVGIQGPSLGSKNHHKGQCRPCFYNTAPGGCPVGEKCNFCHYPHGEAKISEAFTFTEWKLRRKDKAKALSAAQTLGQIQPPPQPKSQRQSKKNKQQAISQVATPKFRVPSPCEGDCCRNELNDWYENETESWNSSYQASVCDMEPRETWPYPDFDDQDQLQYPSSDSSGPEYEEQLCIQDVPVYAEEAYCKTIDPGMTMHMQSDNMDVWERSAATDMMQKVKMFWPICTAHNGEQLTMMLKHAMPDHYDD